MSIRFLISLVTILSISACMKVKPKESPKEEEAASTNEVSYQFIEGSQPNEYKVHFHFKDSRNSVFVSKSSGTLKSSQMAAVVNQSWQDDQVQAGQEVTYEFGDYNSQNFRPWGKLSLKIPQDWVVDNTVDLNDAISLNNFTNKDGQLFLTKYRRIYLLKGSTLILRHYNVKVIAQEIHSDYGFIQTFPLGAKAAMGQSGKSGGFLEIQTDEAQGVLRIDLRGEDGGDGNKGPNPDSSMKGSKGPKGAQGVGQVRRGEFLDILDCIKPPGNGGTGFTGAVGKPGQSGGHGGNSGQLLFVAKNESDFTLQASKNPGKGGSGGVGGDGGEGGEGGDPGDFGMPGLPNCKVEKGEKGLKGPIGPVGQKGSDGVVEAVCELRNSQPKVCH